MPSKSIAQQHLFQAAEHGADFPMADKLRQSMTHDQMHDFAAGPMTGLPQHVGGSPMAGSDPNIVASNTNVFKNQGFSERDALRNALATAGPTKKRSNSHKNLGKFLHPRKDGKPHGSDKF